MSMHADFLSRFPDKMTAKSPVSPEPSRMQKTVPTSGQQVAVYRATNHILRRRPARSLGHPLPAAMTPFSVRPQPDARSNGADRFKFSRDYAIPCAIAYCGWMANECGARQERKRGQTGGLDGKRKWPSFEFSIAGVGTYISLLHSVKMVLEKQNNELFYAKKRSPHGIWDALARRLEAQADWKQGKAGLWLAGCRDFLICVLLLPK